MPETTHVVQISKTGGPEVIESVEIPTPVPRPDELLIKIEYGGVNYSQYPLVASLGAPSLDFMTDDVIIKVTGWKTNN
jgi:NADPH:quinone reductase-like Zn-dependent oxidoreductase